MKSPQMISCTVRYEIDAYKLDAFETYARFWLQKIPEMGGIHHGYHLPYEGPNDIAYCHFSFPSLTEYETYRARMWQDADGLHAYEFATRTKCIRRYDRSFTHPVLEGASAGALFDEV